jgi:hypothetical protein
MLCSNFMKAVNAIKQAIATTEAISVTMLRTSCRVTGLCLGQIDVQENEIQHDEQNRQAIVSQEDRYAMARRLEGDVRVFLMQFYVTHLLPIHIRDAESDDGGNEDPCERYPKGWCHDPEIYRTQAQTGGFWATSLFPRGDDKSRHGSREVRVDKLRDR